MDKYLRQLIFLVYGFLLRWPIWLTIWIFGRIGIFKSLFLIYPTDPTECLDFCPDIKWLRNFLSGRPTPAGLIMDGWRPIGIYLVIPNSSMELMRKKSRPTVEAIINRLRWIKDISGAKTIGLAGQLGPIFEKRHNIAMEPPFFSSTYGNIFSIQNAIKHLVKSSNKTPWETKVAIVGGGQLGDDLKKYLSDDGYLVGMTDVRYTRKGGIKLTDEKQATNQLTRADFAINLLPTGKDFMDCELHRKLPVNATIIDFSRPVIPVNAVSQKVVMGNRVQRSGIHFCMRLPGGWKRHELPACSMPSLLATLSGHPQKSLDEFRLAAHQFQFSTALAAPSLQTAISTSMRDRAFAFIGPVSNRLSLAILRSRQALSGR